MTTNDEEEKGKEDNTSTAAANKSMKKAVAKDGLGAVED